MSMKLFLKQFLNFNHLFSFSSPSAQVSNLALDRRMGFLDSEFTADTRLIIESIQGYQTASNQAMYGLPFWKHVPKWCSPVFTRLGSAESGQRNSEKSVFVRNFERSLP